MSTSTEIREYRAETGEEPLWTNSQFSGMPAFNMNVKYPGNFIRHLAVVTGLRLPSKMGLLYTLLIGFYVLLCCLKVDPWGARLGAIAFGFSTHFLILYEAGHNSKLRAIGFMAPVLASIFYTLRGKTLLGAAFTAASLSLCIAANHVQITYYLAMIVSVIMLVEFIFAYKEKALQPLIKKSVLLAAAAIISIGPNVSALWSTYTYGKETIRGGKSELAETKAKTDGGLDMEYAMRWSYGPMETFTLLVPSLYGGSSTGELSQKSEIYQAFIARGAPKGQAKKIIKQLPLYHGDQPFTSGPVYFGAIICFLFIFGLMVIDPKMRAWAVALFVLSVLLAWGRHFMPLSEFMFKYMPLYNKFRAPSTILVISSVIVPLIAMYGLNKFLKVDVFQKAMFNKLKMAAYITAGLCLLFGLMGGMFFDFTGASDMQLAEQGWPIEELQSDRASLLKASAFKSLTLIGLSFGLLYMFFKQKLGKGILIGGLVVLFIFDFGVEGKKYLNGDHFVKSRDVLRAHKPSQADLLIQEDKDPHYRVFNLTVNPFTDAITSSKHKSIGGYHGAKLLRYQELIERHLSKNNLNVVNMLNGKYLMTPNQQTGQTQVSQNPDALGNAWFVNNIMWVDNADAEIDALNSFNPAATAVIDKEFKDKIPFEPTATLSEITLSEYRPNRMTYKAIVKEKEALAVFSEIYYEGGGNDWKVFIDGVETSHVRANYVLRAMALPQGEHTIEFRFEPESYFVGEKISYASSFLLAFLLLAAIGWEIKKGLKATPKKD